MLWSRTVPMSPRCTRDVLITQLLLVPLVLTGGLKPPLNITTVSRNFSLFLTWLPAPENPPNVSYVVKCKPVSETKWSPIKRCRYISPTECDLTCDIKDPYANYNLKIRSISHDVKSPWVNLRDKVTYIFRVDPAIPILQITNENNTMTIKPTIQKPRCIKYLYDVKYNLKIWIRSQKSEEIIYNNQMVNSTMEINTVGLQGNVCVAAQTKYIVDMIKLSDFSSPVCQELIEQDNKSYFWTILFAILLMALFFTFYFFKCCRKTSETKKPDALIFTNHKPVFQFSGVKEEQYHKITMIEKTERPSMPILLSTAHRTDVGNGYPSSGFGYTEKNRVQEEYGSKNGDSMDYTVAPSQGLLSYPNSDNSSDFSHGEYFTKSESAGPLILTLDDIETKSRAAIPKTMETECINNKYKVAKPAETKHPIESHENVPFSTLWIAGKHGHSDNSDGESCDQFSSFDTEESPEQSNEDLTICGVSDSLYSNRQQNIRCTGYQQRGYMAREL